MKTIFNKTFVAAGLAALATSFASCENGDRSFADYEGGVSVYFATQTPVRTIFLGDDDVVDNTNDNAHKFQIIATMGGAYNGKNITLDVDVDNTLCDNLYFEGTTQKVLPMPESYYTIASKKVNYVDMSGLMAPVDVQLTDAFFADPACVENTYVIPMVIKSQTGADRILAGTPLVDGETPQRTNAGRWDVQPQDYVLYCVKYVNEWTGKWVRINPTDNNASINWPKEEVVSISTKSLNEALYDVVAKKADGTTITATLKLTIDGGQATVSSLTDGITATGTAKYVKAENSKYEWGQKKRAYIEMDATVDFGFTKVTEKKDLVMQTRESNKKVVFSVEYK